MLKKGHNRLTFEEILSKKFNFQVGGYNTLEVDKFLDEVNTEIANLYDEYDEVMEQKIQLKKSLDEALDQIKLFKIQIENLKNQK